MKNLVLIPDILSESKIEQSIFGEKFNVITPCVKHASQIEDSIWEEAVAIMAWHDLSYTGDIIRLAKNCKIIVRIGVGYDNVDLAFAGNMGIPVCNVPDYGTEDVADHAIALLTNLFRGVTLCDNKLRRNVSVNWDWSTAGKLTRIAGATLGIVGLGRIGTAVALRAKALGMKILFCDPYIPDGYDKALGIERAETFDDLLEHCDAISLHVPLTEETQDMANENFFQKMKKDGYFVNVSRGGLVDLDALTKSLRDGRLRGAGLDVLPEEPPSSNHPLIRSWMNHEEWLDEKLIITPHCAFYCEEAYREMREKAAKTAFEFIDSGKLRNCVNRKYLK